MQLSHYLAEGWKQELAAEFNGPYIRQLETFLLNSNKNQRTIYPAPEQIFTALNLSPLRHIRAVILGQDPYHGPGQAHGLAFSVPSGCALPPSLRNIFRELQDDIGCEPADHGSLLSWAEQGVLLLNAVLTVEQGNAGSHQGQGWEQLTDRVIATVSEKADPSVFLLWGSHAQKKAALIDQKRHLILKAPHPSPLSAYRGFFGCRHFSLCNKYLIKSGREPINWAID